LRTPGDLGGELDAIRSQIKRIIRYDGSGNWYDQQPIFRAQGDTSEFVLQSGVDLKINDGTIVASGDLTLDDGNRDGSTWSEPIKLSTDSDEWSALEDVYGGERSLIAMLHDAASSSVRSKKHIVQVNAISTGSTLFVPDVDWSGDAANYVDVLLNGQMLRGGTDTEVSNKEVDYAIVGQNGIHFSFNIPEGDILTFVIMGGDVLGSGGGGAIAGIGSGPSAATTVEPGTSFGLTPAVGASIRFAREDHSHGTPPAPVIPQAASTVTAAQSFGIASNAGIAATFSRADHTHGTPAIPAHSALSSNGWSVSGHTAEPYTVAVFDETGTATTVAAPSSGQRQGKFLSWLNDTQLGWTAPALVGVGLLGGVYDNVAVYSLVTDGNVANDFVTDGTAYYGYDNDVTVAGSGTASQEVISVYGGSDGMVLNATTGILVGSAGAASEGEILDETFDFTV
jgi:hypothetical protein